VRVRGVFIVIYDVQRSLCSACNSITARVGGSGGGGGSGAGWVYVYVCMSVRVCPS